MSPFSHFTEEDQVGGVEEAVIDGQDGSPERLRLHQLTVLLLGRRVYLIETTSHPRAMADLHIRDPKKPVPPATTSRFLAACAICAAFPKCSSNQREQDLQHSKKS